MLTAEDESILDECILFYNQAFAYLRSIDLSKITEANKHEIEAYLKRALSYKLSFQNKITFDSVYRLSIVRDKFLLDGWVKELKYITHPPLEVIQQMGVFGRANSDQSTRFYCSFDPVTAVLETKPQAGDRVIITHWRNRTGRKYVVFPLSNTDLVRTDGIDAATNAFIIRMEANHPKVAELFRLQQNFLAEEYVKDSPVNHPKKYEYLYSAIFSDFLLNIALKIPSPNPEGFAQFDGIVYPNVACQHMMENFVIKPGSVDDLYPYQLKEWHIDETFYVECTLEDIRNDTLPFNGTPLRHSMLVREGVITWNDEIAIPHV